MPEADVINGSRMALIDVTGLTSDQIAGIKNGNKILDGTKEYMIILPEEVEANGEPVNYLVQLS